jgi:hypothetical protein
MKGLPASPLLLSPTVEVSGTNGTHSRSTGCHLRSVRSSTHHGSRQIKRLADLSVLHHAQRGSLTSLAVQSTSKCLPPSCPDQGRLFRHPRDLLHSSFAIQSSSRCFDCPFKVLLGQILTVDCCCSFCAPRIHNPFEFQLSFMHSMNQVV